MMSSGHLFRSDQEQYGIQSNLMKGVNSSGRAMVFITAPNAERTFAVYLGAALELVPEDLKPEHFKGYDYFHIEGYLVQNQQLIRRAVEMAKNAGCIIQSIWHPTMSSNPTMHSFTTSWTNMWI